MLLLPMLRATLRHYTLHNLSPPPPSAHQRMPVAARDDNGVQIINITNPYNPTPASSITDGSDGFTGKECEIYHHHHHWLINVWLTASSGDTGIEIINLNYPLTFESVIQILHMQKKVIH